MGVKEKVKKIYNFKKVKEERRREKKKKGMIRGEEKEKRKKRMGGDLSDKRMGRTYSIICNIRLDATI